MKTGKTRKRSELEGAFTAIARATSKHWGVEIIPSGGECSTDGNKIRFPWNGDDIDSIPFEVLNGYLDHEVGHIAEEREHRDAGRATPLKLVRGLRGERTVAMLFNVVEDIRMEIKRGRVYPGVASNLRAANIYAVARHRAAKAAGRDMSFWNALGCGIILRARDCDTSWMDPEFEVLLQLLENEIAESKTIEWGEESLDLARRIYEKVKDFVEESESEQPEGGEGEPQDGDEGESKKASGESAEAEEGDGDAKAGEARAEDSKRGKAMDKIAEGVKTEAESEHLMDEVAKAIEKASESKTRTEYCPASKSMAEDRWIKPKKTSPESYNTLKREVNKEISALKAKLQNLVRARTDSRHQYDQEQGSLDTASLHQLRVGSRRVFSKVIKGIELDTAVSILVDESGSMIEAGKSHNARLTAIALAETFDALGVPFEIIGFTNDRYDFMRSSPYYGGGAGDHRLPFTFRVYKGFSEQHRVVRTRLAQITHRCENADGEAVLEVARRLNRRPESRKIMFVLSDGVPACPGSTPRRLANHLHKAIKQVRSAGIELFGIGLMVNVSQFYGREHSIQINRPDQMAREIYKLMRAQILAGFRRAA